MMNYVFVEFLSGKNVVEITNEQEYSYFRIFLEFIGVLGLQERNYEYWLEQTTDSTLYFEYGDAIHLSCARENAIQVLELLMIRNLDLKEDQLFPSFEQYRYTIQQRATTLINGV
ncbi:MAG: hypothetical protein KBT48_06735 [Firmicutes bacterium]|nr:hypothetical protein [Bacillota bacterium]